MTIVAAKTAIRAAVLARRAGVPAEVREAFAQRLATIGPSLVRRNGEAPDGIVSVYHPIRDEVDTVPLFDALLREGFVTALPVTVARREPLRFYIWRPGDPVAPGRWTIPEPLPTAPEVDPDVLFVPLAAFDRRGFRLGYGAGFYDASLNRLRARKPVLAVGVAYAVQEVEAVPCEAHDEPLDAVITERDIIFCGAR